jgi:hypothetical protein
VQLCKWLKKPIDRERLFEENESPLFFSGGGVRRRQTGIILLIVFGVFISGEVFADSLTVTPPSFNIPRGQSSASVVVYRFAGNPAINTALVSPSGTFVAAGSPVGSVNVPVHLMVSRGSGNASEAVQVPVRIIEETLRKGLTAFTYVRTFSGSGIGPFSTVVTFMITTEAGSSFNIRRIVLYFENRRPETVVERNGQVSAYADIGFVGSGLLQGYWEVDGRILSRVDQHLTFGGSTTLQTPSIPPLPTFDQGTHVVRFVVTNPAAGISIPSILYFVIPENATCSLEGIRPLEPPDGIEASYAPLQFAWEKGPASRIYLIAFYEDQRPDAKPIFSAYIKEHSYTLPEQAIKNFFTPGRTYYWKVAGFDDKNAVVCENRLQSFSFKE